MQSAALFAPPDPHIRPGERGLLSYQPSHSVVFFLKHELGHGTVVRVSCTLYQSIPAVLVR